MFRKSILTAALLALGTTAATAAKLPLYDDFTAVEFDSAKWVQAESGRTLDSKGRLSLKRNSHGLGTVDTGLTFEQLTMSATDNAPARGLRVQATVASLSHLETCAANPYVAGTRARMMGSFFSVRAGGPVAGDAVGDIIASMHLRRVSSSTDPVDTLRIAGFYAQCSDATCTNVINSRSIDLGTVVVGQKVQLQLEWDKANQQFVYIVDGGTPVTHS